MCRPDDKLFLDVFVDDEVEISLSESCLFVLQTEMEAWQHVEARGKEGHRLGHNTQLPLLRLGCRENNTSTCNSSLLYIYIKTRKRHNAVASNNFGLDVRAKSEVFFYYRVCNQIRMLLTRETSHSNDVTSP